MQVIVFASRKGGAGKTTLATHVAVEAFRRKAGQVVLIDTDPMGGLSNWWNARKIDGPEFSRIDNGLPTTLDALKKEGAADLVVIDTPPAATTAMAGIIAAADLVVVPVIPSANDLRAINQTLDLVEEQNRPMVFVINNASTSGRTMTHEASSALSQHGRVCPIVVRNRQDFRSSMTDGRTAGEINPKSKSAEEVTELWKYLKAIMEKEKRRGRATSTT